MTNVTTVATMRPRRIALVALVAALLSGVAFMATSPTPAQATQGWNSINGWNVSPYPFRYTHEPRGSYRNKTDPGPMKLNLTDNVTNGLCVMARATNGSRLGFACWLPGEYGIKLMASNVPAQPFTLWAARRGSRYTTSNAGWDGTLYY